MCKTLKNANKSIVIQCEQHMACVEGLLEASKRSSIRRTFNISVDCYRLKIYPSIQFNHSVMSDSFQSHELPHARLPCPSPSARLKLALAETPSRQRCHPNISSPVIPFSSCLKSFQASGVFPVYIHIFLFIFLSALRLKFYVNRSNA